MSNDHQPRRRALALTIRTLLAAGTAAVSFAAGAATLDGTGVPKLHLNAGRVDLATLALAPAAATTATGKQLRIVQFADAIKPEWHAALRESGLTIVDYIPDYAYLVYGDPAATGGVAQRAGGAVLWEGPYGGAMKISQFAYDLESRGVAPDWYTIQLVADPVANDETITLVKRLAANSEYRVETVAHYVNLRASVPFGALSMLADRADVISIQPDFEPTLLDERQNLILANRLSGGSPNVPIAPGAAGGIGYRDWLLSLGFTQQQFIDSGFVVDVSDQGLDNGTTEPNHFALFEGGNPGTPFDATRSLVVYNKREGTAAVNDLTGCGGVGHGTWVSHVVGGSVASVTRDLPHGDGSFHFGGGVNPFARVGNSAFFTVGGGFTNPDYEDSKSRSYANLGRGIRGARISNNSWGAAVSGAYNADAQAYDRLVRDAQPTGSTFPAPGNQELVIVFAAGNSGSGAQTVGAPGTAKNVITAGGSQNVRPGVADAANADAMYTSSSRGPAADGRYKPDLIAPATNVAGGVVMNDRSTAAPGNWNTCYTGAFLPTTPQQRFYRTGNGTSFSSPAVAGAASLVRQWFINRPAPFHNAPPSPAMTKAFLTNAAQYMETLSDNLPSNNQGTGRMNLERTFDNTPRVLRDQLPGDRFTASAQTRTFTGTVADNTRPFRVTLAWTDAPGSTTGAAAVNNLDLEVTVGGQTYRGNRFTGRNSTPGAATADTLNNVESVFIPAGVTGPYTITVRATNIAGQADTTITGPNQDFALVAYNSTPTAGCPAFDVTPTSIPLNAVGGTPYPTQTFTVPGGAGTLSFTATGNLPPGMSFSGSQLTGTPSAGGMYNFTVYAEDTAGCIGGRGYQINVVSAEVASTQTVLPTDNGLIEPNECNDLNIRLVNNGGNPATAVSATVTTTTPGVTISQGTSTYPDLAALGGNAFNDVAYKISTDGTLACGSIVTVTQTATFTGGGSPTVFNYQFPVGSAGGNYLFGTPGTGATIPAGGTLVTGSAADDALVSVTLPADFSTRVYGTVVPAGGTLRASTNGNLQFVGTGGSTEFANGALPAAAFGTTPALLVFWDDLDLRTTGGGIYTNVVGTAPNRQFVVEWRGRHFSETSGPQSVNVAIVLNEGSSGAFEYRYAQTATGAGVANGASATVGVQATSAAGGQFTQSSLNQAVVTAGRLLPAVLETPTCNTGPGVCSGVGNVIFIHGFE